MNEQTGQEEHFEKAQHIAQLISGYIQQTLSPAQHNELDEWIATSDANMRLFEELTDEKRMQKALDFLGEADRSKVLRRIKRQLIFSGPRTSRLFSASWHYAAAACLILLIGAATFFIYNNRTSSKNNTLAVVARQQDLQPGKDGKAYLTLADGSIITLDEKADGKLAAQGSSDIVKQNGLLQYNSRVGEATDEVLYNTITTPAGASYPAVTLSDGTRVWLDASSSIKFPAVFKGKERRVVVSGQFYFEVAKNKSMPFIVEVKDKPTAIEVLGTHFNINAYPEDAQVKTTLLEGSVKVTAANSPTALLKPGQQAQATDAGIKINNNADLTEVMAWKNGNFNFNNDDIVTIMKQVSRWYDVDISYEATVNTRYTCLLSRDKPASSLFKVLEETGGVHFKIDGKKVRVLP